MIVSVGTGRYSKLLDRQMKSFLKFELQANQYKDCYPHGSPTHEDIPYAFKTFAFEHERKTGGDKVIWMDSAVWAQHQIHSLYRLLDDQGYFIIRNGWSSGEWCTDQQLYEFNLKREEAFSIPHPMACVYGLNFETKIGNQIQDYMLNCVQLFRGAWSNERGQVSSDKRVLGSRHDQSVLGLVAHKLKLNYIDSSGVISYDTKDRCSLLLSEGC